MGLEAPQFCLMGSLAIRAPCTAKNDLESEKNASGVLATKNNKVPTTKLPDFPDQMPESPFHLKCADPRVDRGRGSEIQRDPVQSDPRISLLGEGQNKER